MGLGGVSEFLQYRGLGNSGGLGNRERPTQRTKHRKQKSSLCYQMYFYALLIFMTTAEQKLSGHLISELGNWLCPRAIILPAAYDPMAVGIVCARGYLKLNKLLRLTVLFIQMLSSICPRHRHRCQHCFLGIFHCHFSLAGAC